VCWGVCAGGISCGKLQLEDTCTTLCRVGHSSFLFMLLMGVVISSVLFLFAVLVILAVGPTESGISKLCLWNPNVTCSFCFKACVMDLL